MNNPKVIFVTGVTGNQGGAVARNLINKGFKVRALTRNPTSAQAQNLREQQVDIIEGDLNEQNTFSHHLKNIDGIFSVQTFENGIDKEIKQGINLANLAKEYNVPHFLYSSVVGADLQTGIPHFESKLKIEAHIKQLRLPYTILRPTSFYENFLITQVRSRLVNGKLVSPIDKNIVQQFISTEDIGRISAQIFINPGQYEGRTITMAVEQLDLVQVSGIFSKVLEKEIRYQKLPGLITRFAMGKDLYKMFKWINENGGVFIKDIGPFQKEFPDYLTLEEWIKMNFKKT